MGKEIQNYDEAAFKKNKGKNNCHLRLKNKLKKNTERILQ